MCYSPHFVEGIETSLGGGGGQNARGRVRNRELNPYGEDVKHKTECIVKTNPDRSVLITTIPWHFGFRPVNVRIFYIEYESCLKWEQFRVLLPLLRHVVLLNDGNRRLTIPVVKGRCAHVALPQAFYISVFKFI